MNIPVRGIQIVLIAGFFIELTGLILNLSALADVGGFGAYTVPMLKGAVGQALRDLAYTLAYLAPIAIIELLYRIWRDMRPSTPLSS